MLRRLRPPVTRFPASYTRCRQPSFPRRQCEPPRPIRCVQTARTSVTISSQPFCPVSPPGCLRARLGSLRSVASWMIGACRSRCVGKPRVSDGYCVMTSSIAGEQPKLCRSAGGDPSNRLLRSKGRHSDGNATAPPDSAAVPVVFLSCYVLATHTRLCGCAGLSYPSHSTSQLPQSHGSELHEANETGSCSFTLAQLAYWYEPAVCAKISIKTCAFGR